MLCSTRDQSSPGVPQTRYSNITVHTTSYMILLTGWLFLSDFTLEFDEGWTSYHSRFIWVHSSAIALQTEVPRECRSQNREESKGVFSKGGLVPPVRPLANERSTVRRVCVCMCVWMSAWLSVFLHVFRYIMHACTFPQYVCIINTFVCICLCCHVYACTACMPVVYVCMYACTNHGVEYTRLCCIATTVLQVCWLLGNSRAVEFVCSVPGLSATG